MMQKPDLLAVEDAIQRICAELGVMPSERCCVGDAAGRILAEDIHAQLSHPARNVSAMDGYAVHVSDDSIEAGHSLSLIGEAAAGHPFDGSVSSDDAVRIFTGAWLPDGANAVLLQEDASAHNGTVHVNEAVHKGQFVRQKGLDFETGEILLRAGEKLNARGLALAALAGCAEVIVRKQPKIAILSSGDELVAPGTVPAEGQLVNSNSLYLCQLVTSLGAHAIDLGIISDRFGALNDRISKAISQEEHEFDMIICTGGASVGDHDHIHAELSLHSQNAPHFWRIAMRPGKPLMFGKWEGIPFLGLPGNPVSAGVCGLVFIQPALNKMLAQHDHLITEHDSAVLSCDIKANDKRQDYLRARLEISTDGQRRVTPMPTQDSSMLRLFSQADALIIRPPFAPPAQPGDIVPVLLIPHAF